MPTPRPCNTSKGLATMKTLLIAFLLRLGILLFNQSTLCVSIDRYKQWTQIAIDAPNSVLWRRFTVQTWQLPTHYRHTHMLKFSYVIRGSRDFIHDHNLQVPSGQDHRPSTINHQPSTINYRIPVFITRSCGLIGQYPSHRELEREVCCRGKRNNATAKCAVARRSGRRGHGRVRSTSTSIVVIIITTTTAAALWYAS